jgi:hypothetical protein
MNKITKLLKMPVDSSSISILTMIFTLLTLLFLLTFQVKALIHDPTTDDQRYYNFTREYSLKGFIQYYYTSWSGRMTGNGIAYLFSVNGIWPYRIVTMFSILLTIYSISKICFKKSTLITIFFTLAAFSLFGVRPLASAFFWIIGAPYYGVPVAFGLYTMTMYADTFFYGRKKFFALRILSSFIASAVAIMGNEQLAFTMIAFIVIFHVIQIINKNRIPRIFYMLSLFSIFGTIASVTAPGDFARWHFELRWFPNFDKLSLAAHIHIGMYWLFDSIVNKMESVVLLLSLIPIISSIKTKVSHKILYIFVFQFLIIVALKIIPTLTQFNSKFNPNYYVFLYNFSFLKEAFDKDVFTVLSAKPIQQVLPGILPFIFWGVYLLNLFFLLVKYSKEKVVTLLLLLAGLASLIVMWFSPTLFASENRVLYVCCVLWSILFLRHIPTLNVKRENQTSVSSYNYNEGNILLFILFFFSGINLLSVLINWIIKGFYIIY